MSCKLQGALPKEKAEKTLTACLRGGRLPHALLIEGPKGELRERLVVRAAQGALCEAAPETRPCLRCRHCEKADKNIHPDFLRYGGEGGARSFHIETVRTLRQQAYIRPNEAEAKVLLLTDVEELSVQAQNALLKIIEEPPGNVFFLLTCENRAALLETILSRVTVISLRDERAPLDDAQEVGALLYDLIEGSELEALAALRVYEKDRPGLCALLERLAQLLAQSMLRPCDDARLAQIVARVDRARLLHILAILEDTVTAVNQNVGGALLATSLCARIRAVFA